MVNYQMGKIYKITSTQTDKIYVGSTCKKYLSERLSAHKSAYRTRASGRSSKCASFDILCFDDAMIVLIELFPCNSKDELFAREQHHMDLNKQIIVNQCNAKGRNIENLKEYQKQWKKENPDSLAKTKQKYRATSHGKETEKNTREEYRCSERGKAKAKEEQARRKLRKYMCECGSTVCAGAKSQHLKSTKHIDFMTE